MKRREILRLAGAAAMLPGAAHAASGSAVRAQKIFFPPAPDAPRIQYLKTFSGESDLAAKKRSAFASFILGDEGPTDGLRQPYGTAMHDGKLYVADTGGARLVAFDLVKQEYLVIRGNGAGAFQKPINITIDANGTKYVCDTGRRRVVVLDRGDRVVGTLLGDRKVKPVDCAISGDVLHIVDIAGHRVVSVDKRTGQIRGSFGKPGSKPGELFHPTNIDIGPNGDIYVVETSNFRVQRFNAAGDPLRTYGAIGDGPGRFARPKGLAIDKTGRLFVGDSAFENVQVFDPEGQLLMYFGNSVEPPLRLNLPAGISIDYEHVNLFDRYADSGFKVEFLILVASQFGPNKIDVFGFGTGAGATPSSFKAQAGTAVSTQVV